jgi:hypothetical protein
LIEPKRLLPNRLGLLLGSNYIRDNIKKEINEQKQPNNPLHLRDLNEVLFGFMILFFDEDIFFGLQIKIV